MEFKSGLKSERKLLTFIFNQILTDSKITNEIREQVHPDADVIVGSIFDEGLEGSARVSVVATGLDTTPRPKKSIVDLHISTNVVMSENSIKEKLESLTRKSIVGNRVHFLNYIVVLL